MNKKNLLMMVTGIMMIFVVANGYAKDEKKGPKIVLEEEEITLYEDGKEIKKILVSKYGNDRKAIFDVLEQKIYKKLGVSSYTDLVNKKLAMKYNEESKKLKNIKRLEQPKLKFLDETGNVKKEILLTTEKKNTKIKDKWANREWDGETVVRNIPVIVSKNQQFAVAETSLVEQPIPTTEYLKVYEGVGQTVTGQITVYDVSGGILFKKDYPRGTEITGDSFSIAISDIGTIAVITNEGEGGQNKKLYAYDKNGNELLVLTKEGENIHPEGDLDISPNGKYLSVSIRGIKKAFINLETKKSWVADKDYVVYSINNDGMVDADYQFTPVQLDLQKLMGE